jgi:hypothetical protein
MGMVWFVEDSGDIPLAPKAVILRREVAERADDS